MSKKHANRSKGPMCYQNWHAALEDKPLQWTVEVPLYSDVGGITGQLTKGFGPYQLLNTGAFLFPKSTSVRPVMVLRVDEHQELEWGDMDRTETQDYHGGSLCDEIAALVSLCLGIRLKAGEISRRFDPKGDPKGSPQAIGLQEVPVFSGNRCGRVLPEAVGERSIQNIPLLCKLPKLCPKDAAVLVRSARMYQEAIWVAEAQPELSWLLLVSSVEVVADHRMVENTPIETMIEIMRTSEPELVAVLEKCGDEALVREVAQVSKKRLGATRKFSDFLLEFCPPPPKTRPSEPLRVVWKDQEGAFRKALTVIYGHRSRALHGGIPFPPPMCEAPLEGNNFSEIPIGLATKARGGTWVRKDTPMLLHAFEYIVRNALLNWWESLPAEREGR